MSSENPFLKTSNLGTINDSGIDVPAKPEMQGYYEIGESGVPIVSPEVLIPDFKMNGLDVWHGIYKPKKIRDSVEYDQYFSHFEHHRKQATTFCDIFANIYATEKEKYAEVFDKLKGQVVVDLGAGRMPRWVYSQVLKAGAKGYMAVDLWNALEFKSMLKCGDWDGKDDEISARLLRGYQPIPATVVAEDILSFLERLPDSSVSICAFGLTDRILPQHYAESVAKEIERVLHDEGVMFSNSDIDPDLPNEEALKDEHDWNRVAAYWK